jgi:hypothetical protein
LVITGNNRELLAREWAVRRVEEAEEGQMSKTVSDATLQKSARIAGFMFLFIMAISILGEVIRYSFIVPGDIAGTSSKIQAGETLFRVCIAVNLFTFTSLVVLPLALYVLLKSVNRHLALLGLLWRFGEAIALFITSLNSFYVLHLLTNPDYSALLKPDQLNAFVKLFLNSHSFGFVYGMLFLGLGSLAFNYVFLKSNYIPKLLAGFGIFANLFMLVCTFLILLLPGYASTIRIFIYIPMFIDEVVLGFWLLIRGVNLPVAGESAAISNRPAEGNG